MLRPLRAFPRLGSDAQVLSRERVRGVPRYERDRAASVSAWAPTVLAPRPKSATTSAT